MSESEPARSVAFQATPAAHGGSGSPGGRPATLEDVAARAGVSRGTVSRALNKDRYVSSTALAAVQRAVTETGYVANLSARGLVTRRSGYVAFVVSEPQEKLIEDPNFSVLVRAATRELSGHDMHLSLVTAGNPSEYDHVLRLLRAGHVDGALLVSAHRGDPILESATDIPIPVVACGRPLGHESSLCSIAADDRAGARQMVNHLAERGRHHIATITGPLDTPGGVERLEGYRDVAGRKPDERLIVHGDYTRSGGEKAMARLLEQAPGLDAVFVASDVMASGALAVLRRANRAVPHDVAVGGFDDSHVAQYTDPLLTTIRQPFDRIVAEMVTSLIRQINGHQPAELALRLPTQLVQRDST